MSLKKKENIILESQERCGRTILKTTEEIGRQKLN